MQSKNRCHHAAGGAHALLAGVGMLIAPLGCALAGQSALPSVSVGAGVRASFASTDVDTAPSDVNDFAVDSARIYISGKATENIGLMFNTEYNSNDEEIRIIDAALQLSFSERFNIWAGRFLPPSDRANLYGPYYANHWGVFRDGVQDGYPFETEGRDDGVMYWGQFGIAKVSAGAFDVTGLTTGESDVLYAARVQLDFWDPEAGYYLNGTYYGEKDLLAVGLAAQSVSGDTAYSVDFLLEKKLAAAGVVTVEAQYAKYDGLGGYPTPLSFDADPGPGEDLQPLGYQSSDGWYLLGAYVLPQPVGPGRLQLLAKYAEADYDFAGGVSARQETSEINLNYLIRSFNARVGLFWIDIGYSSSAPFVRPDVSQVGLGLQVQI